MRTPAEPENWNHAASARVSPLASQLLIGSDAMTRVFRQACESWTRLASDCGQPGWHSSFDELKSFSYEGGGLGGGAGGDGGDGGVGGGDGMWPVHST